MGHIDIFAPKCKNGMNKSLQQYDSVLKQCRDLFIAKTRDYGTAWRILRPSSLTDQIFIKARRIRSIQEKGVQRIDEAPSDAFIAMVNYGVMALIQTELGSDGPLELGVDETINRYDTAVAETRALFDAKNHDYGEAWRDLRVSSMTDLILMKILRIKQIEDNEGQTEVSEGVKGGYQDIINYSIFALIKLSEKEEV